MELREPSRIFWLNRKPRADANSKTQFFSVLPFLFNKTSRQPRLADAYEEARDFVSQCSPPGLAIVAASRGEIQAKAFLTAKPDAINTAIVGRHSRAEVFLGGDPSVSLRHIGVIVHGSASPDEVRFRLVDLRTAGGFRDGKGVERRAVESNAPYLAGCGRYSLVFAPVTEPLAEWPAAPERFADAFDVDVLTNPETVERLRLEAREDPLGELVVTSARGTGAVAVSRRAVRSGILLGRSDRCDGEGLLYEPYVSRVHLLIVEVDGRLYAIDTASTNGVLGNARRERATVLETGTTVSLAGLATVEWRFFH